MIAKPKHELRLFDEFARTDMEYAKRTEKGFPFLNRSALPEFARMREELEDWFSRYEPADAPRMRREFRSRRAPQHVGALFELFIHEHLLRAGFEVQCQIHLPGTPNKPDFLVLHHGVPGFYVEATARLGSENDAATEQRYQEVIEAIRDLRAPDYWVHVIADGALSRSVDKRGLRRDLKTWLANLDHAAESARFRANPYADPATYEWECEGLCLTFEATPRSDLRGFDFGDFLMAEVKGGGFWKPNMALAHALEDKATRYGSLDLPYLIAVDLMDLATTWRDVTPSLQSGWGTESQPRNTGVSGVLLAFVPSAAAAVAMAPLLVANPAAVRPLSALADAFRLFDGTLQPRLEAEAS